VMTASFCTSSSVNVWTVERFERRAEGNAEGLDLVVMEVVAVSYLIPVSLMEVHLEAERALTFVVCSADFTY